MFDATKLQDAFEVGHERLEWSRRQRTALIQRYVGPHWGQQNRRPRSIVNLIAQTIQALLPALALNNPRVVMRPTRAELQTEAMILERLVNQTFVELDAAEEVYREMVMDAMVSPISVSYTGLRTSRRMPTVPGQTYDPGEPYMRVIDWSDYSLDPACKDLRSRGWEAFKTRLDKRALLESPAFADRREVIDKLNTIEDGAYKHDDEAVMDGRDHRGQQALTQTIEVWQGCIYAGDGIYEVTVPTRECGKAAILRIERYEGPDGGPFDHLTFYRVPGSPLGVPLCSIIRDVAEALDNIADKYVRGAEKSKTGIAYTPAGKDDAQSLTEASDFFSVKTESPDSVKVLDIDLTRPELMQALAAMQTWGNTLAGNPTLIGGAGKISDTATEADILAARSGIRLIDLQQRVATIAKAHARKLAFFLATNPMADYMVPMPIPGSSETIMLPYTADSIQGRPDEYLYDVDVTSMAGMTPEVRSARLLQAVQVFGANIPLIQAGIIDGRALLRVMQREMGISGLDEVIVDPTMMMQTQMVQAGVEQVQAGARQGAESPTIGPEAQPLGGRRTAEPEGAVNGIR